jgi:hypothetical protein
LGRLDRLEEIRAEVGTRAGHRRTATGTSTVGAAPLLPTDNGNAAAAPVGERSITNHTPTAAAAASFAAAGGVTIPTSPHATTTTITISPTTVATTTAAAPTGPMISVPGGSIAISAITPLSAEMIRNAKILVEERLKQVRIDLKQWQELERARELLQLSMARAAAPTGPFQSGLFSARVSATASALRRLPSVTGTSTTSLSVTLPGFVPPPTATPTTAAVAATTITLNTNNSSINGGTTSIPPSRAGSRPSTSSKPPGTPVLPNSSASLVTPNGANNVLSPSGAPPTPTFGMSSLTPTSGNGMTTSNSFTSLSVVPPTPPSPAAGQLRNGNTLSASRLSPGRSISDQLRLANNLISNPPPSTDADAGATVPIGGARTRADRRNSLDDDGVPPITPRSAYARKNADKLKSMVSLLMQLDVGGMSRIREAFAHKQWGMSIYEFVVTLQVHISFISLLHFFCIQSCV